MSFKTYLNEISYQKQKEIEYELRNERPSSNQKEIKALGMWMYKIPKGEEKNSEIYGIKKTKSGKFGMTQYNTSGKSFWFRKEQADNLYGKGYWVEFK